MRKILLSMLAVVALFVTSCVQSDVDGTEVALGQKALVSLSVEASSASSRTIADGTKATNLQYAVYEEDWTYLYEESTTLENLKTTLSLELLTGYKYHVVLWADAGKGYYAVDFANKKVDVEYDGAVANDESRDAFYAVKDIEVKGNTNTSVKLTRPFAQINFGASDLEAAKKAGFKTENLKTNLTVSAYETLNFVDGSVANPVEVVFAAAAPQNETATLTAGGKEYAWISMNYVLCPAADASLSKCTMVATDGTKTATVSYPMAPARRNWKTNLVGTIFTDSTKIEVEVTPGTDGESTNANGYYIVNDVYYIVNVDGFKWFADQVDGGNTFEGKTVVLDGDIDLTGATRANGVWTPIGSIEGSHYTINFRGVFDGAGHTVKNFSVNHHQAAGLFGYMVGGTIKNLTVENATFTSNHYAGAIVAWIEQGGKPVVIENCHVKNVELVSTPELVNGVYDNGDKVGALVGFAYGGVYKNNTVENATVKGYRDLGGFVGYLNKGVVSGNTIKDVTITQDLTNGYKTEIPTTLGEVVGRYGEGYTVENNTVENVNVGIAANNVSELNSALAASDNASIVLAEGTFNVGNGLGNGNAGELVLTGAGIDKTTIDAPANQHGNNQLPGLYGNNKDLVFKNLTFVTTNNGYEGGIGHAKSVTFINCKIVGQFYCHSNAPHTFVDCTIDLLNGYLYTYASNCDFEGCTFTASQGKALQVYAEAAGTFNVNIKNCEFTAAKVAQTWDGKPVTAIDINSANGAKMVVNIENCEATGFGVGEYSGSNLWNIKPGALNANAATVTIDGKLAHASNLNNVAPGSTVVLAEGANLGNVTVGELKDVTIEGNGSVMIFKTDANTKIENVTLKNVDFEYTGATVDCGVVVDANAQIDNLVLEGCNFTGTGAKAGRGISGLNNNASIVLKDCNFKDLGYPIYAWGGYKALTIEGCTFENIKSWAIMPQSGFNGDLTVAACNFTNCLGGGLIKAGTLTAGHTFTFTNNVITGCTVAGDHNWFQFNVSAGTSVISGNTKDGAAWTPGVADGLK